MLALFRHDPNEVADVPLPVRDALFRRYGTFTQAYSVTYQRGLLHYGDDRGFLAYKMVGRTALVLADPVAAPSEAEYLVDRFLREHPDATFWHISRPLAGALASRGFRVNELGRETRLDLATYTFKGRRKTNLRNAAHRLERLGYLIREGTLSDATVGEAKAVSSAWRRTRTIRRREVGFLTRPITFDEEPDVRWFFAHSPEGKMVGFCVCDPIYEEGTVIGYLSVSRQRTDTGLMIGHALKRHAIEVFQREGKRVVSLGLSPADGIEDKDFTRDWLIRRALRFAYTNALFNRFVYSLQGHAAHKRQFDGIAEQTYAAINRQPSLPRLLKLLRACGIV